MFKVAKIRQDVFHSHYLCFVLINEMSRSISSPLIYIFKHKCKVKAYNVTRVYQKITVVNRD